MDGRPACQQAAHRKNNGASTVDPPGQDGRRGVGGKDPGGRMERRGGDRYRAGEDRGGNGEGRGRLQAEVVRRTVFLVGDAVGFLLFLVRIRVVGMGVVAAMVDDAFLVDEAYHRLVVVMGHDGNEEHHQHRQQVGYDFYLPQHDMQR